MAPSTRSHGRRFLWGVLFVLRLAASLTTFLAIATEVYAQTDVPGEPTDVAVYIYSSQKLKVPWSNADASNTTSF